MSIFNIFKKKGNPQIAAEARKLARNQIRMETDASVKAIRPDGSKIGGRPYLPADFVWPTFTGGEDSVSRPLSFFCQINLVEVKAYDKENLLPDSGMLYFFYECESFCWGFDPEDKGAAKVIYYEDITGFAPRDIPTDLAEEYIMPEMAVKFVAETSYPRYEELEIHSNLECDWEDYDAALAKLGVNTDEDPEGHKLLGYADVIQNEMLSECERVVRGLYCGGDRGDRNTAEADDADIQEKAKEWTLLLQLGTIEKDDFEWMFGDCGMLYYYIKKEDLAVKRFENIWFSLQCG